VLSFVCFVGPKKSKKILYDPIWYDLTSDPIAETTPSGLYRDLVPERTS
jgi:hypothetical protein